MLISLVLTLQSDSETTLPGHLGRANYAATLARLKELDPALAARIHDEAGPKPLTCSGLLNVHSRKGGVAILAGKNYFVHITGLSQQVTQALMDGLVHNPPEFWELDRHPFRIRHVTVDPKVDPWAGTATYEELAAATMLQSGRLPKTVTLDFSAPTAFKSTGQTVPIPLPGLVFGSLVDRWNAFSPILLSPDMRRFGEEVMVISRYRLQSKPVIQKNGALRIGGVGAVTYRAMTGDRYWLATMQMLADFARFSGVGVQTATGMGQVRRMSRNVKGD